MYAKFLSHNFAKNFQVDQVLINQRWLIMAVYEIVSIPRSNWIRIEEKLKLCPSYKSWIFMAMPFQKRIKRPFDHTNSPKEKEILYLCHRCRILTGRLVVRDTKPMKGKNWSNLLKMWCLAYTRMESIKCRLPTNISTLFLLHFIMYKNDEIDGMWDPLMSHFDVM